MRRAGNFHKVQRLEPKKGAVPANNLDAEAAVLSAILNSREALDDVASLLKPEHFYSDSNAKVYECMLDLASRAVAIDVVSLADCLRSRDWFAKVGGVDYMGTLWNATPSYANVSVYANIVHEKWRVRELATACHRGAAGCYGDVGDVQGYIDQVEQSIFDIAHQSAANDVQAVGPVLQTVFQRMVQAAESGKKMTGTPTGYYDVDELLAGLHGGDLTIVAGRPGMGKSAWVMNTAVNVARGHEEEQTDGPPAVIDGEGVAVFSLEMPREQLATRMMCAEARVDIGRVRINRLLDADWTRLQEAGWMGGLPIWIDDTPGVSLLDLRSKVRRIQAQIQRGGPEARGVKKLGLVVVDYLQLMKGRDGVTSREQEISELSRGLKQLAKELKVPVIALSQLNRAVETRSTRSKRPQLSDLRESGAIEQDADNIIFITRREYYDKDACPDDWKGVAELEIAKQRNGATGRVYTRFEGSCTRFDNLAREDWPQSDWD